MVKYQSFDAVFVKKSNETVLSLKCFERFFIVMNLWMCEGGVAQKEERNGFCLKSFERFLFVMNL
jgi:hypothetical protein